MSSIDYWKNEWDNVTDTSSVTNTDEVTDTSALDNDSNKAKKCGCDYIVNVATREIVHTEKANTYDKFIAKDLNGNVVATSKEYKAGTISVLENISGKRNYQENGSMFVVSNNKARIEIFEFLAKNTKIEWSTLRGKINRKEANHIGTNYMGTEVAILHDKFYEMLYDGTVNEYTHNHTIFTPPPRIPSGYDPDSADYKTGDHGVAIDSGNVLLRVYDPIENIYYRFWTGGYEKEKK